MVSAYVNRYHCEPASRDDDQILCGQICLAADYRRELAAIENRHRALLRSPSWLAQAISLKAVHDRRALEVAVRELVTAPRPDDGIAGNLDLGVRDVARAHAISVDLVRMLIVREQSKVACGKVALAARKRATDLGLYWGTYQATEEAIDASRRTTPLHEDVRTWCPRDTGLVAVHLQPARTLRGDEDRWIRIGSGLTRRGSEIDRSGRVRPARHREVKLRVGTAEDGAPTWATLLVLMHRDLPDGAVVSWAKVKRRRVGARYRWGLHLTIATQATSSPPHARLDASCGVDIGWRRVSDGVRIASWWGTDGRHGDLVVPTWTLSIDEKADSLRGIRDRNRNALRDDLRAWLSSLAEKPVWLAEATVAIHAWVKAGRFVRLAKVWRDRRIPGDDVAWSAIQAWLKQDRHLWNWEASIREQRQRKVAEQIRTFAVELCRAYGRIGIEAPLTAELIRKPERRKAVVNGAGEVDRLSAIDDGKKTDVGQPPDGHLRRIAATRVPHVAPALTRREIRTFAPKYGALAMEFDPADTTLRCDSCGHRRDDVVDWSQLEVGCSACGVVRDQDQTAAVNLARLASAVVLGEDGRPLASVRYGASAKKLGHRRTRRAAKSGSLEGGNGG